MAPTTDPTCQVQRANAPAAVDVEPRQQRAAGQHCAQVGATEAAAAEEVELPGLGGRERTGGDGCEGPRGERKPRLPGTRRGPRCRAPPWPGRQGCPARPPLHKGAAPRRAAPRRAAPRRAAQGPRERPTSAGAAPRRPQRGTAGRCTAAPRGTRGWGTCGEGAVVGATR
jgi:hypothetical protein